MAMTFGFEAAMMSLGYINLEIDDKGASESSSNTLQLISHQPLDVIVVHVLDIREQATLDAPDWGTRGVRNGPMTTHPLHRGTISP